MPQKRRERERCSLKPRLVVGRQKKNVETDGGGAWVEEALRGSVQGHQRCSTLAPSPVARLGPGGRAVPESGALPVQSCCVLLHDYTGHNVLKWFSQLGELATTLSYCMCGPLTHFAVLVAVATDGTFIAPLTLLLILSTKAVSSTAPSECAHIFASRHQLFFSYLFKLTWT